MNIHSVSFLESMANPLANGVSKEEFINDISDDSNPDEEVPLINANICVVCLEQRNSTWIFMPRRFANCCGQCSERIEQLEQTCSTLRCHIDYKFQIFLT